MGSTKTTHRILMGYPGPNCSRSLANRQPTNQWLPANHSPASSRLSGQALAVGDGERISCRQAARPGCATRRWPTRTTQRAPASSTSTSTTLPRNQDHRRCHSGLNTALPCRDRVAGNGRLPANPYRNDYKPRSRTSPCCTAAIRHIRQVTADNLQSI